MAGYIRASVHSLHAKLQTRDEETLRALELTSKSGDVVSALEHYASAYQSFAAASRQLYSSIGSFYPAQGSLRPALDALVKNTSDSPFSDQAVTSRIEAMRQLEPVVSGLGALTKRIADTIVERNVLAQEKEHYLMKVGALQANLNTAKPAHRDAAKEKLTENQVKLRKVLDEHAALARRVEDWTASLDSDMASVLGPTVLSVMRTQAALHTDCAAFNTACIGKVGTGSTLRPSPPPQTTSSASSGIDPYNTSLGGGVTKRSSLSAPQDSLADSAAPPPTALVAGPAASDSAAESAAPIAAPPAAPPVSSSLKRVQPFVAVADADWAGQAEGDLALLAGALVLVFGQDDDGWWDARVSDESGLVPSNFCTVPTAPPPALSRMTASDDYTPDDPSELSFKKGDVIDILTPTDSPSAAARAVVDSGWLLGRLGETPGFVPSTYLVPYTA